MTPPAAVFDDAILAKCCRYWMRAALVVDMTFHAEHGRTVSRETLADRVAALVADGRLEADGELVRLPTR